MNKIIIFLNYIENLYVIKKKIILIIKKNILTFNFLTKTNIKINKNTKNIAINNLNIHEIAFFKNLNKFIKSKFSFKTIKMDFSGKGFKIKKLNKICIFVFNKSHKIYIKYYSNINKKITKNNIIICSKNNSIQPLKFKIIKIFPYNIFTKKGIKSSNQLIKIKKK